MSTTTRFMFGDGRPFPFLFLSKDYARLKNGAKIVNGWAGGSGITPSEVSGFPRENVGDGSRATYCEITDLTCLILLNLKVIWLTL